MVGDTQIYTIPDSDIILCVYQHKLIGKIENNEIKRLTFEDIYNNPGIWFMMEKHNEYLCFSNKQYIIAELQDINNDILSYLLNF
jgi:hypothetical protein